MNTPASTGPHKHSALYWGVIFAVAGFTAGFFGPRWLNPEQGSLTGMLLTGPVGLLLGIVLGALGNRLPLTARATSITLFSLAMTGALAILYFCLPPPKLLGYNVDAETRSCHAPQEMFDTAVQRWQKTLSRATVVTRPGWQDEMRDKTTQLGGVVVEVQVMRWQGIYQDTAPWSSGTVSADRWRQHWETYRLYRANALCNNFPAGARADYFLPSPARAANNVWPPDNAIDFLELHAVASLPPLN